MEEKEIGRCSECGVEKEHRILIQFPDLTLKCPICASNSGISHSPPGADPKQVAGDKKDQLQLLPPEFLRKTANVLKLGADKYGVYNWRHSDGIKAMTYVGAIMRHLMQFVDGEDVDEESGISHIAHIAATCAIMLDASEYSNLEDNRP